MLVSRRFFRVESVVCVKKMLFSTSNICSKKKGLIRRPLRMWTPGEAETQAKKSSSIGLEDATNLKQFPDELTNKRFTLPDGVSYVRLEDGDKRLRPVLSAKSRKDRREKEVILLEGQRLITDAIDAGVKIKHLYFSKVEHLQGIPLLSLNADLFKLDYRQMQLFSDVATTTGLIAIAELPCESPPVAKEEMIPITLICDNIREPGNMGTIIRSAAAIGCQRVILTKGCVDIWEPKVLRSGAGAHFRCNLIDGVSWDMVKNYLSRDCRVFLADNKSNNTDFSEGAKFKPSKQKFVEIEHSVLGDHSSEEQPRSEGLVKGVNVMVAYDADFTTGESALVIGGETHGISLKAYKLCSELDGCAIYLPMLSGVESINAAMATTTILFEAKRQFMYRDLLGDEQSDRRERDDEAVSN